MSQGRRYPARAFTSTHPPQDHYDWGLRAIKSVLVVAGSLKRGDPTRAEDQVLMRALRDFNIPKIVTDDLPVFMGLIGDLFPALDVPRKRDMNFEKVGSCRWTLCQSCGAWGPSSAPSQGPFPRVLNHWLPSNIGVGGQPCQPKRAAQAGPEGLPAASCPSQTHNLSTGSHSGTGEGAPV